MCEHCLAITQSKECLIKKSIQAKQGLSGNQLKLIAIICMTIDHLAWVLFPGYSLEPIAILLHLTGRIAAPIFCFFIAEGFFYTHDLRKYILRLLLFAIPSHFAYLFCFGHSFVPSSIFNQTSVLWAFAGGLVALAVNKSNLKGIWKTLLIICICVVTFPADWSCIAVLVIYSFGTNRGKFKTQAIWLMIFVAMYAVIYVIFLDKTYGILQMGVVLSLPLLYMYNGERGKCSCSGLKWGFYIYYPLHLFLLGLLRLALRG